ncbi:selenoprotein V-like [Macrobrachium rosenbergii]|uniref:selenoprotein V-like n=1 Tax=Macrobrachium rosenbergii TaxID=79674 RepID=UPI0034D6C238
MSLAMFLRMRDALHGKASKLDLFPPPSETDGSVYNLQASRSRVQDSLSPSGLLPLQDSLASPRLLRSFRTLTPSLAPSGIPCSLKTPLPVLESLALQDSCSLKTPLPILESLAPSGLPCFLKTPSPLQDSLVPSGLPCPIRTSLPLQASLAPSRLPCPIRTPLPIQDSLAPSGLPCPIRTPLPHQDSLALSGLPCSFEGRLAGCTT